MIIYDFNITKPTVHNSETYTICIVDTDAVLPFAIAEQLFKMIGRRNAQII